VTACGLAILCLLAGAPARAAGIGAAAALNHPLPHVANNAALSTLPHTAYPAVVRDEFAVVGDAPSVTYTPSPAPCSLGVAGAGDGGSQVPTSDRGCWIADPIPTDPLDYGANPLGSDAGGVNETALANAIAAQTSPGCRVSYSPGTYRFTAAGATLSAHACRVSGQGRTTAIDIHYASGAWLTVGFNFGVTDFSEIDHLSITHSVTRAAFTPDIDCNNEHCQIHDLLDLDAATAIVLGAESTLSVIDNVECQSDNSAQPAGGCIQVGIAGGGTNTESNILENVTCDVLAGAKLVKSYCIEEKSGVANLIINPNFLLGDTNLLIDPGSGDGVLDTKITGGYIDSAVTAGILVRPSGTGNVTRIYAQGAWIGDTSAGSAVVLDNLGSGASTGFYCDMCQLVINTSAGLLINTSKWSDVSLVGGCIAQSVNGVSAVSGVARISIEGTKIGACLGLTGPATGVRAAGSNTKWIISHVDFTGSSAAISTPNSFVSATSPSRIEGNIGYNPVGTSAGSLTGSPMTLIGGPTPETDWFSATSGVTIDNQTVCPNSGACTFDLDPGQIAVVTYSGSPTFTRTIH
jgi:hypothetical protein